MASQALVIVGTLVCLALMLEFSTCVIRTWERDERLRNQYKQWCDKENFHRCNYTLKDFQYFQSVCSADGMRPRRINGARKEYRCMTRSEREGYHNALVGMKNTTVGAQSEYDGLVVLHDGRTAPSAHFSPGFCPWHRVYLHIWERAIRRRCSSCFIPFWDSRLDARLGGNPRDSVLFSPQLAGNADGVVRTGFAANWGVTGQCATTVGPTLRRLFDTNVNSLYSDDDVRFPERATRYEDMAFPFSNTFEFTHGYIHTAFGGGQMSNILCSPFDPMFLPHHSFVEKMCETTRLRLRNTRPYPDISSINAADITDNIRAAAADNVVRPFNSGRLTITHRAALLDDELNDDWYVYERSPADVRCRVDADCCANGNTEFLWCNRGRCASKAQSGARISAAFPANACYCATGTPANRNGVCGC